MTQPIAAPPGTTPKVEDDSRHEPACEPLPRRRRRSVAVPSVSAGTIVAICIAVHLLAAALIYRDMVRDLYTLFDAAPRLLVLERGLVRLTATSVFLPPIIPTALLGSVALWLGEARRDPEVGRWLSLAAVPLAADDLLRAVGVLIAPTPTTIGELLELPSRFSPGPRMVLDLIGAHPSPGIAYWVVVCTVASGISAWYVARALVAAESVNGGFDASHRRRNMATLDALRAGTAVAGTWVAMAFAGQVALPWATQLFLQTLG